MTQTRIISVLSKDRRVDSKHVEIHRVGLPGILEHITLTRNEIESSGKIMNLSMEFKSESNDKHSHTISFSFSMV